MTTYTDRNRWFALYVLCGGMLMIVLDATIVNVALPTIERDLGFSQRNLLWVLNAYTLVFGGFLLLGGRLADRLGRRRLFVAGTALFTGASLICGVSQSEETLLLARGAQGLGGALVSPAALSIILTTFAEGMTKCDVDECPCVDCGACDGQLDLFSEAENLLRPHGGPEAFV